MEKQPLSGSHGDYQVREYRFMISSKTNVHVHYARLCLPLQMVFLGLGGECAQSKSQPTTSQTEKTPGLEYAII